MLNLKTYFQEHGVVAFGNLDKPTVGMGSSQRSSTGMAPHPAGVMMMMTLTLTLLTIGPLHAPAQQPRSMLTETLERLGAPMVDGEDLDDEYRETTGLLKHPAEAPHPPAGPLGPSRQWGKLIALVPLTQAPPRKLCSPYSPH